MAVPGAVSETGKSSVWWGNRLFRSSQPDPTYSAVFSGEIVVKNDAKAAVLGEWKKGNLRKTKNAAAVVLGTGVGLGIILNGEVYQGTHRQAGEVSFSFVTVRLQGLILLQGWGFQRWYLFTVLRSYWMSQQMGKKFFDN